MKIQEFTKVYTAEYNSIFHTVVVSESKKSTLSRISEFLFEPRYEVKNLNFKLVA